MNDNAMMEGIIIVAFIILVIGFGYTIYQQEIFKVNAKEVCKTIIDLDDNKTIDVRIDNYIGEKVVYHGYDVCINKKTGEITSNKSLGYDTELNLVVRGMI